MKAAIVSNPHYFRRVNASVATICELGDSLVRGDVLADVVTGKEYVVDERGLPPTISPQARPILHWSRMVSVTFRGRCEESEGRLLFVGDVSQLRCLVAKGQIGEKSQPIPVDVPIVGAVRFKSYDCPAVLKVSEQLRAEVVILAKDETRIGGSLHYVSVSPDGMPIEVRLNVALVDDGAESGRILEWNDEDTPVVMT